MLKNSITAYGFVSRLFHWIIALLIIGLIILGKYMADLPEEDTMRLFWYSTHKALGILVLELALLRILWISYSHAPALGIGMKTWERILAKATHIFLYFLMVAIPVSGYIMSAAGGYPISFFDLYPVPSILEENEALSEFAHEAHYWLAHSAIVVIIIHILAGLKHHFINKDDIFKRML